MDAIASGFGNESTDRTLVHVDIKPLWLLRPLPLSQIRPDSLNQRPPRGPPPSLASYCLTVISHNLHLIPAETLNLPTHLAKRAFVRFRADRFHGGSATYPDEATLWAYSALSSPENTERDCTLNLSSVTTVKTLPPNPLTSYEHPINVVPRLFSSPTLSMLTTLTVDGIDNALNDSNILNLKWCSQLTCLWMRGCREVTDAGIRLLASSLELGESRGLCRLRAWWLNGCIKVSDKSMKSFARWPGLVLLDLRNTSCTTVALAVFNRSSQAVFAGVNADFQSCTDGLRPLFSSRDPPAKVLENLSLTLLGSKQYLALHIRPSSTPLPAQQLPEPPTAPKERSWSHDARTTYRGGGIGQVYGATVSRISNPEYQFRQDVKTALRIQSEEDHDDALRQAGKRVPKRLTPYEEARKMTKEWTAHNKKVKQAVKTGNWEYMDGPKARFQKRTKKEIEADERSRAMVTATRIDVEFELVEGEEKLMMVRMVDPEWEQLTWAVGSGSILARMEKEDPLPQGVVPVVQPIHVPVKVAKKGRAKTKLVEDIMIATVQPAVTQPFAAFRPTSSNQGSSSQSSPASSKIAAPISRNPFRSNTQATDLRGPRTTPQSSFRPESSDDDPWSSKSASDPFSYPIKTCQDGRYDDSLSFDTTSSKKRTWGGANGEETKRRGLKMFSSQR